MHSRSMFPPRFIRVFCSLAVLLAAFAAPFSLPPTALAAPKIVGLLVNSALDTDMETCAGSPTGNDCTLRGAIKKINTGALQYETITFAPSVTITALFNPLPAIVVTGTTISGNSGVPRIDALFMSNGNVFSVSAPISEIAGLSIVNGHTFADGIFADIWVEGGTQVWIDHNYLGTLPPGPDVNDCNPNPGGGSLVSRNSGYGIFVNQGVTGNTSASGGSVYIFDNTIGCHPGHGIVFNGVSYAHIGQDGFSGLAGNFIGANSAGVGLRNGAGGVGDGIDLVAAGSSGSRFNTIRGNTIENNGRYGILLSGTGVNNTASTYSNLIAGNRIGIDDIGPYANDSDGIALFSGAFLNFIGGTAAGDRNIISGSGGSGIHLSDSNGNAILGNFIGTGLTGALAAPSPGAVAARPGPHMPSISVPGNQLNGIRLNSSDNNQIGGAFAADRNVISGNFLDGVLIDNSNNNQVGSNLIGLDASGTRALANGQEGVGIDSGSTNNEIGSVPIDQEQYISGNAGSGVLINGANGNFVRASNRIGIGTSGLPLGNGYVGVLIIDAANNDVEPALVANNGSAGVAAVGNSSIGNFLSPFAVYANTGIPVDLGLDGPTPNDGDADIGPNNLLEYPIITAAAGNVITGTVCAGCAVYVFQAVGNPGLAGGGGTYKQSIGADGLGHWHLTLHPGLTRQNVTLQAYDGANTSELSPRPAILLPLTIR